MSFSRSAVKRFNEETSCAPPVGHYHPKYRDKQVGACFDRSKRFSELDGNELLAPPGSLSRTQSESSTATTRSPHSSVCSGIKATPKTEQDYLNTIKSLREEIAFLRQRLSTKPKSVAGSIIKCKGSQEMHLTPLNNPDAVTDLEATPSSIDVFFPVPSSSKELASETPRRDAYVNTSRSDKRLDARRAEEIAKMKDKILKLESKSQKLASSLEDLQKKTVELEGTAETYASLKPKMAKFQEVLCELVSDISSKVAQLSSGHRKHISNCEDLPQTRDFSVAPRQMKCLEQLQELSTPHLDTSAVHCRFRVLGQEVSVLSAVTKLLQQQDRRNTNKLVTENMNLKLAVEKFTVREFGKAVGSTLLSSQESQIKILQSENKMAIRDSEKKDQQVRHLKASIEDVTKKLELTLKELQILEETTIRCNKTILDLEIRLLGNAKALDEANASNDKLGREIDSLREKLIGVTLEKKKLKDELDDSRALGVKYVQINTELKEAYSNLQNELDDSRVQIGEYVQLNLELKEEKSRLQNELDDSRAQGVEYVQLNNELKDGFSHLQNELDDSRVQVGEYVQLNLELKEERKKLKDELDDSRAQVVEYVQLNNELKAAYSNLQNELDDCREQVGEYVQFSFELKEERSKLHSELEDSRAQVCEYVQLNQELKEELNSRSAQQDPKSLLELENLQMALELQRIDIQRLEEENQSADKENSWKSKFEELEKKVAPFRDQLDGYARERDVLLLQYSETSSELAAVNEKYARSMGHQNHKQKIRYVEKLQTEINQLRQDVHHWQQKFIKQQLELEALRRPQHGSSHNTPVKSKSTAKSAKP